MTPDFFDEKSKTGLGFEIGQSQRKCQRRPTLQSMANPALWKRGAEMRCMYLGLDVIVTLRDLLRALYQVKYTGSSLFVSSLAQQTQTWYADFPSAELVWCNSPTRSLPASPALLFHCRGLKYYPTWDYKVLARRELYVPQRVVGHRQIVVLCSTHRNSGVHSA